MTIVAALKKTTLAIKEWVTTKIPTEDIAANTAARHTHDNKDVLDGITGVVTGDDVLNAYNSNYLNQAYNQVASTLTDTGITLTDVPNVEVLAYIYALILMMLDDYASASRLSDLEQRVAALEEAQRS